MKRALQLILMGIGATTILLIAAIAACYVYFVYIDPDSGKVEKRGYAFILNWSELNPDLVTKVTKEYHSGPKGFGGDHLDAYDLTLSSLSISPTPSGNRQSRTHWKRIQDLDTLSRAAFENACLYAGEDEIPWFPRCEQLIEDSALVWIKSMEVDDEQPESADIIFGIPSQRRILYMSYQF